MRLKPTSKLFNLLTQKLSQTSKKLLLGTFLACLFLMGFPASAQAASTLDMSVSPVGPVKPGTKITVNWSISSDAGSPAYIGGGCAQVPPVSEAEVKIVAQGCGNNLGIGGGTSGAVSKDISDTTQFIVYNSRYDLIKHVTVQVDPNAPDPGPGGGEFKIVNPVVDPKTVTGGKGTAINLGWGVENGPGTYEVTYTTKNDKGEVLKDKDGKPIENQVLDAATIKCEPATTCKADISRFGAAGSNGETCAGVTEFKIKGTGTRNNSEATATLTVNKGESTGDQSGGTGVCDQNFPAGGGLVNSLFDFLRRVVAYIVLLMTGFIYFIFSVILVPVLNALLSIHAYKDNFVNFIYPGWVIIRNISNIAFIIALLVMGLRILFQQEDAGKARGFIVTLVLMALLVNFSLVIAQGVVGIADTVTAQFLPKESKVIEALGWKLMVEPIKVFRGGSTNLTSSGNFDVDASASDIYKPIALLVLAIAAFFSFIALIAFIFVRLMALWVLYLLSPLAYVARILPETRKHSDEWWSNLFKYAFTVPILAFFLNITALMATTFANQSGDVVEAGKDGTTIAGSTFAGISGYIAGEYAEFAITVISHFIVLLFLYAGMHFALKGGTAGSKQIIGAAKKGFDFFTTKPAKYLAKDLPKEMARQQYERKIAGGLFDPKAWKQSWKDRVAYQDKTQKAKRLMKNANRLQPGNVIVPDQKLRDRAKVVGRYLSAKLRGQDPHKDLARAEAMKDKASIMTAEERTKAETQLGDNRTKVNDIDHELSLLDANTITAARSQKYKDDIDDRINSIDATAIDLENKRQKLIKQGKGGGAEAKNLEEELRGLKSDRDDLVDADRAIDAARARNPGGDVVFNNAELDSVKMVFEPDELQGQLSEDKKKAQNEIEKDQSRISEDDDRKRRHSTNSMTNEERRRLEREAAELAAKAAERYMPASVAALEARRSLQSDMAKKIEHIDDVDALVEAHEEALSKNNAALAIEIQKKLAKLGGMDELLGKNGYSNNLKDFQKFMDKKFANIAPQVRIQMGSEVSQIAKSNGNLTLGNSTKYKFNAKTGETVVNWASPDDAKRKLNAKLKGTGGADLAKKEMTDISEQISGVNQLHRGFVDALNNLNTNGLNAYFRNLPSGKRDKIRKMENFEDLNSQVKAKFTQKFK